MCTRNKVAKTSGNSAINYSLLVPISDTDEVNHSLPVHEPFSNYNPSRTKLKNREKRCHIIFQIFLLLLRMDFSRNHLFLKNYVICVSFTLAFEIFGLHVSKNRGKMKSGKEELVSARSSFEKWQCFGQSYIK